MPISIVGHLCAVGIVEKSLKSKENRVVMYSLHERAMPVSILNRLTAL